MKLRRDHRAEVEMAVCLQERETWETFKGDSVLKCVSAPSSGRVNLKISERISGASDAIGDGDSRSNVVSSECSDS